MVQTNRHGKFLTMYYVWLLSSWYTLRKRNHQRWNKFWINAQEKFCTWLQCKISHNESKVFLYKFIQQKWNTFSKLYIVNWQLLIILDSTQFPTFSVKVSSSKTRLSITIIRDLYIFQSRALIRLHKERKYLDPWNT